VSEEEQITAIGHAVQAAAASKQQLLTLEAALEHAAASLDSASQALRDILAGGEVGLGRDIFKAIKAIPDIQRVKEWVREFGEVRGRHTKLAERARQLSGL
jgi:hypothetical protein